MKENKPALFDSIYDIQEDNQEEKKENAGGKPKKQKKKEVAFAKDKKIRVITESRGGKKKVTTIFGLENYGCDLADIAKVMAKRFGTGASSCEIDYKEERNREGILIQGDVQNRFEEFIETELKDLNIDLEKVFYE